MRRRKSDKNVGGACSTSLMATSSELLTAVHSIFGNRDAASRRAAIEAAFAEDAVFTDPERTVTGWDAIDAAAAGLLAEAPEEFVLAADGLPYTGDDIGAYAWTFGPAGAPAARGIDIITVEGGRITALRTLLYS